MIEDTERRLENFHPERVFVVERKGVTWWTDSRLLVKIGGVLSGTDLPETVGAWTPAFDEEGEETGGYERRDFTDDFPAKVDALLRLWVPRSIDREKCADRRVGLIDGDGACIVWLRVGHLWVNWSLLAVSEAIAGTTIDGFGATGDMKKPVTLYHGPDGVGLLMPCTAAPGIPL